MRSETHEMSLLAQSLQRAVLSAFFLNTILSAVAHGEVLRSFTVADEIGLAHFGDPYGRAAEAVQVSPDGRYFAALTERGRIDLNSPEDVLRIYRVQDVLSVLGRPDVAELPAPLWSFNRSTDKDGPLITHWRWLKDSSGIAFLERGGHGSNWLMLASLQERTIERLTPEDQPIKAFDIRDRKHYVYAVSDPGLVRRAVAEGQAAAIVGTERSFYDLMFPADKNTDVAADDSPFDRSELWAVVGGEPFRVEDGASNQALVLFDEGLLNLALSPDGQSVLTALAVAEIPSAWEKLYRPPFAASAYRLRAGKQDLSTFMGGDLVSRYVRIELRSGTVQPLSDGPTGRAAGWWQLGAGPAWAEDGKTIVLSNVFVAPDTHTAARPCVAVVSVSTATPFCVELIEGPDEKGGYRENFRLVTAVRFVDSNGHRLTVSHYASGKPQGSTEYRRTAAGAWAVAQHTFGADRAASGSLDVAVRQGLNEPPVLRASDSKAKVSRVIWDPNPQLKDIALGEVAVYRWKDNAGRDWKGGLFKPMHYEAGRRYPLVIQTHGFSETEFRPSGVFPTAFAARALAGAGLVVLQVQDCSIYDTPEEGPCNVGGYEAAVSELVKEGIVDPERIGIIGFSRTCFDVMEALTTSTLHIKAASITDGAMADYFQYLLAVDIPGLGAANEYDAMVGAAPFGEGLQQWLKRSPLFNMDKVSAALQVVAEGRVSLATMWGPNAAMRYLHKPVDLILLNNDQHVLSNPSARLASQGGTVDWMRFWLQGYEDPSLAKTEQYKRWRGLRRLQEIQNNHAENPTAAYPIPH
jgi:hypothetical protein